MSKILTVGGPSGNAEGIFPERRTARFMSRAGATISKGSHVQVDLSSASTEVDNINEGAANSAWTTVLDPVSSTTLAGLRAGIFAVALEDVADNEVGEFLLQGVVKANVDASTVAGSLLVPAVNNQLDLAATTDLKVIAIALEDDSAVTNEATVWFDGLYGFGSAIDA